MQACAAEISGAIDVSGCRASPTASPYLDGLASSKSSGLAYSKNRHSSLAPPVQLKYSDEHLGGEDPDEDHFPVRGHLERHECVSAWCKIQ